MGQLGPFIKSFGQAELSCAKAIRDSMSKNTFSWTGAEKHRLSRDVTDAGRVKRPHDANVKFEETLAEEVMSCSPD